MSFWMKVVLTLQMKFSIVEEFFIPWLKHMIILFCNICRSYHEKLCYNNVQNRIQLSLFIIELCRM